MQNPVVTITDITETPKAGEKGKPLNLGNADLNKTVGNLLAAMRERAKKVFHLKWEGSKIPRGAIVEGIEIAWTQNGQVSGAGGEMVGTYERLVEFGGPTGNEQQMLVFIL